MKSDLNKMKTSIAHLPISNQEDLKVIVATILEQVLNVEMIILFGSYARGSQVALDRRMEYGISTSYRSDYDILVVASRIKNEPAFAKKLNGVSTIFRRKTHSDIRLEIVYKTVDKVVDFLEKGDFFYAEIRNEGIMLYDTGSFILPTPRQPELFEVEKQARNFFQDFFHKGERFLKTAKEFDYPDEEYKMASFHLHQACESFFYAISLTFGLYKPKEHDLRMLMDFNRRYSEEIMHVFPRETEENEHLFELLRASYIQSRYNNGFVVNKEDVETLIQWMERFRDLTGELCMDKLSELERLAAEQQASYKRLS
ncbi:HEPN domain-containing protein [Odoribacter lunatus]|uniref:HEPN domain-containing protein n=1 Tax=Odoribacter lunatus TaxID=2941335 RepID=UPI00203B3226|nr:HEPN domain-containing protein [Odoribacter lunatus]